MEIEIPLHWVRMGPNIPGGMNLYVLASIAHQLRTTNARRLEPLPTVWCYGPMDFEIDDGKHRFIAHYLSGRSTIIVKVNDGPLPDREREEYRYWPLAGPGFHPHLVRSAPAAVPVDGTAH